MSARTPHRREAGFTLIELMISLVIASLAIGFIFRIYATSSVAYRTQSQVAELQQTLRTAKQLLSKELRSAGYFAGALNTAVDTGVSGNHPDDEATPSGVYMFQPIQITNSSSGPDSFTIAYGDTTCMTRVSEDKNTSFNAAATNVDNVNCFQDGDVVAAVRMIDSGKSKRGWGCILAITGTNASSGKINHNPGQGAPYNKPSNDQCENIDKEWADGFTAMVRFRQKSYRIKPNDARGVLQMLPAGSSTWEDLAFGFVDMQLAVQVYDNDGTDQDGDGKGEVDWYSGANMGTLPGTAVMLQMRISLVARTIAEVEGVGTLTTPSMIDPANTTRPSNNKVGDRASFSLASVTNTSSPYYGNYVYRMVTTVVDLRNIGTGQML